MGEPSPSSSPMRRAIARRMSASKREIPHFYVSTTADVDRLSEVLARETDSEQPTFTACLVRAASMALARHPSFNATWVDDRLEIANEINVAVAIALDAGLIAPALMDCADRSLTDIASSLRDLVARARAGRIRASEYSAGTFTISNLGMFDVDSFSAIIVPPQVAILAVAAARPTAAIIDGEVTVRKTLRMTLSADHRAVDGADAARFLSTLKRLVEDPSSLFAAAGLAG